MSVSSGFWFTLSLMHGFVVFIWFGFVECVLGDLFGWSLTCASILCFAGADAEVGWIASAYRRESLNHTLRILGRYIVLDLVLSNIVFHRLCAWI